MAKHMLVKKAQSGGTITYGDLMKEMKGPGRGYIGEVLEALCREEHEHARPMLGAIVIHKSDKVPGHAFWSLPWIPQDIKDSSKERKINYWKSERERVYHYWQNHNP
jgi:hypothetical protein